MTINNDNSTKQKQKPRYRSAATAAAISPVLTCLLYASVGYTITGFTLADSSSLSSPSSPPPPPSNSIPRSTHNSHFNRLREAAISSTSNDDDTFSVNGDGDDDTAAAASSLLQERPPWNPSPQINDEGFCRDLYTRIPGEWESEVRLGGKHQNPLHLEMVQVNIRQVPGDGNCLFHSISTCMAHVVNGTRLQYPNHLGWLYRHSAYLRQQAVDCLRKRRKTLFLQGNEYLRANDLVEAAAAQYGISGTQYCDLMQQDSYWGGGPEIVALCNVLRRPIHVYELASSSSAANNNNNNKGRGGGCGGNTFVLRRMACFGSPKFDKKEPFHILSADSRFPDIAPGSQLASGNHFLAVFPVKEQQAALQDWIKENRKNKKKGKHVRGGSSGSRNSDLLMEERNMALKKKKKRRRDGVDDDKDSDNMMMKKEEGSIQSYLFALWKRFFVAE